MSFSKLNKKIIDKKVRVSVVGLGYVGLPLSVEFAKAGVKVEGIDISKDKVVKLKKGISYIQDVPSTDIRCVLKNKRFKPTTSFSRLKEQDAVIICVPTPLRKSRDPDISFIVDSAKKIAANIKRETLVILESTSYPGTTERYC